MKKILLAALLLVVAGVGFLYLRLDSLVKSGLETYGSRILKAPVTVGRVSLSPFSGEGALHGLTIGSPAGFSEPYVLKVDAVRVRLEPKSLTTPRVVIREVAIEGPELRYERGPSGSNLDALQRNAQAYAASEEPAGKTAAKGQAPSKKVVIERFTARGGKAVLNVFGARAEVSLPDVSASGIGEGGGTTPAQAAQRLLGALSQAALQAAGSSKGAVKNLGGAVTHALKGLFGR